MKASRLSLWNAVPLFGQLRHCSLRSLRGDVVAGFAVAVTLVPQGLGYGQLAGLPPVAGLYTAVGAMVVFALVTSTRVIAVGPSSTLAIMTFTAVSSRADGDAGRATALAACLALMTGALLLLPGRLRGLTSLLSAPVLLGYLAGTAVQVMASQVGKLVGVKTDSDHPMVKVWEVLTHLDQVQWVTAAVGVATLLALVLLKPVFHAVPVLRAVPVTPVVCVVAVAVSAAADLAGHGVAMTGRIAGGLPAPGWPGVSAADVWALLPAAAGMAMIASIEGTAALRRTALPSAPRISLVRESVAMGAASAGAGALGGFASMPGTQRTLSARGAGAHSQLFQLVCAGFVVVGILTTGPVIGLLPVTVLAAVVMVSASHLFDFAGFERLWHGWRRESVLAIVTMASVVALGVLNGLLVAVVLALMQLLRRVAWPHDAVLVVPDDGRPPHEVAPDEAVGTDVLIYRVDAPLFFANAGRISQRVLTLAAARSPYPRYVVLDAEAVFYLDATAAETLAQLATDLRARDCQLVVARPREQVLTTLRESPYQDGATRQLPVFPSVREAYDALRQR
ncbi:SulP family inorganic anion transporter [Streptomyces sp. DK15]|uniref:SulP family inorganic anion transporter n=1 Tax=Streptomyces sp. DK15 TaxID=2957499 RepID=UPI0029A77176|nr:SulP family inorganic anion transporter [Streptomyces sp. DK15]MDX2391573.1 SulP family inorganic anion transporter [Streptomyces sp. DK15]